jgi:molybdenum cofactor cytidylyltransferase
LIAALVLAAGAGSRFGGVKLLARLSGKPILQHVLDRAREAGVGEVVVVLGADADAIEAAVDWDTARRVRNPEPARGLASSLQVGMAELSDVDAVLVLLGDQPLVAPATLRALLDAPADPARPVVVPAYAEGGGRNPVVLRRSAFGLVGEATGDRGLGPVLDRHPELVHEIAVPGANPDVDTTADLARLLEAAWGARVRANAEQVERFREVPDGVDFYAPVRSLFRADPARSDDPVLTTLLEEVRAGETWLDVGAGAGRYALPLARALAPGGGRVVAVDPSPSMLEGLNELAAEHGIGNVRTVELRWPPDYPAAYAADVVLIAHVGYDIEAIGPFIDGLEAAARRLCVAVLMTKAPASAADPFWPRVHGEARVPLPALTEFVELLGARGRAPMVQTVTTEPRHFHDRDMLEESLRRQLWIDPAGPKAARLQAALAELAVEGDDGWMLRDRTPMEVGVVTWAPHARRSLVLPQHL